MSTTYLGRAKPYRSPKKYAPRSFVGAVGVTLPHGEEAAYRDAMGRDFDPSVPAMRDFGAPCADMFRRNEDGILTYGDDYYVAFDAWVASERHAEYVAALRTHTARRDQFSYSPRKRNRAAVLARAVA